LGDCPGRLASLSEQAKVKILQSCLGHYYKNNSEYLFQCPHCNHHKKKLSINIEKNVFKCWVCDWSGKDVYRVVRRYGTHSNRSEWRKFDQEIEIKDFAELLFGDVDTQVVQEVPLPKEFISLANKNLPKTSLYPLNYLHSRGIGKADIIRWKIGYCSEGEYAGRVVVPSFSRTGKVNYFVTRTYADDWRKYLNPPISKEIIFNDLYLDFDEDLVLVEGVFDAVKVTGQAVPLLGSTLREEHPLFQKIVENDTPIYLALDPDAKKKTDRLIQLMLRYDIETYVVDVPSHLDVGDMTKEQFLEIKQAAAFLNPENYLLGKIAGL